MVSATRIYKTYAKHTILFSFQFSPLTSYKGVAFFVTNKIVLSLYKFENYFVPLHLWTINIGITI